MTTNVMPLTVESAAKELKDLYQQVFSRIGKLMDGGLNHQDSLIQAYEENPEWAKRERQLLGFLEMAKGHAERMEKIGLSSREGNMTFSEREGALKGVEDELDLKTRAKMAADPKLQYHEALKLVASENPRLDRLRTKLYEA